MTSKVERKTVKLLKPHRHKGELHEQGAELSLRPDQVQRLQKKGKVAGGNQEVSDHVQAE